jgi:pre-rRNA-processing protein TSR4
MAPSDDDLAHLVGVLEDVRYPHNSRFLFPSKIGGLPAWMIPERLPVVSCDSCSRTMSFLLQIYAPDEEVSGAFHRSILVFVCTACRCFLKAYRVQLPLENEYYPPKPISPDSVPARDEHLVKSCCENCGLLQHGGSICHPLPEYGLSIEELDEIVIGEEDDEEECDDEDMEQEKMDQICRSSEMPLDESETDLFNEFTETAIESDTSFRIFKKFVEEAPVDQVLYYSIGGSPVWITDENQMPGNPPPCERCGADRQFEFQIQPQLIYHLMKRLRGFPMNAAPFEWGVVAVYTCSAHCSDGKDYREEFVYNQLEPAEWLEFGTRKKVDFSQEKGGAPKIAEMETTSEDEGEWM